MRRVPAVFTHSNDTTRWVNIKKSWVALRFLFCFLWQQIEVQFDFIIPPNNLLIISTGVSLGLVLLIVITVVLFKVRLKDFYLYVNLSVT